MAGRAGKRDVPRVFISYRRQDAPGHAGRLYDGLVERFGERGVFMDIDAIRPGTDFTEAIDRALGQCDVFLAVIGRSWLASADVSGARRLDDPGDYVRREIEAALQRGIPVIPLLVESAEMPAAQGLPDSVMGLAGRQAFEMSDRRWGDDVRHLLEEIEELAQPPVAEPVPEAPVPPLHAAPVEARRRRRRLTWMTAGALAGVVALAAILVSVQGDGRALAGPTAVALAGNDGLYVSDTGNNRIVKVLADGTIRPVAGGSAGREHFGDGGPATTAELAAPAGIAALNNTLYIADYYHSLVRRIDPSGTITTVAGDGQNGFSGDHGAATTTKLTVPAGVAVARDGTVFIADQKNNRIRAVTPEGFIKTEAGNGRSGFEGDGPNATETSLNEPTAVALSSDDTMLFVADTGNHRVRRVDLARNEISTVAGDGNERFNGDGLATVASLSYPGGLAVTADGALYIADTRNNRIRKVVDRMISTVAGNGEFRFRGDGDAALDASLAGPKGVAVDSAGTVYIADTGNNRVRVVGIDGKITTRA